MMFHWEILTAVPEGQGDYLCIQHLLEGCTNTAPIPDVNPEKAVKGQKKTAKWPGQSLGNIPHWEMQEALSPKCR